MYVFSETFGGVLVNAYSPAEGCGETLKGGSVVSNIVVPLGLFFSNGPSKTQKKGKNVSYLHDKPISDKEMSKLVKKTTPRNISAHKK
jgi:hypothetical protein